MTDPQQTGTADPVLSLRHVSKRFGAHFAVNDVSFDVLRGDIFGFLGPNGAGKSTTMYMISSLVRPTSGDITIFGKPATLGPAARIPMGTLIETPAFYEYMSGRKNLEVMARSHGGIEPGRVDHVLDRVGLTARGGSAVREYSHGMKQRLGIAQALMHRPQLLLLDEPTNGLDPDGSAQVWQILRSLVADEGMTVLVSSHLLHEVEENCNRIAVINQGIVVACDYVKRLLFFNKEDHLLVFDDGERCRAAEQWLADRPGVEVLSGTATEAGEEEDCHLRVRLRQGIASEVVSGLVQAGHAPRAVVPQRKTLKQFFLELTRRQDER